MPGHVEEALHEFQHQNLQNQMNPHIYGQTQHMVPTANSPLQ